MPERRRIWPPATSRRRSARAALPRRSRRSLRRNRRNTRSRSNAAGSALESVLPAAMEDLGMDPSQIREHMEVLGSDGGHVGVVDAIEGGRLKLTRQDPAAAGTHHYIALDQVTAIEEGRVRLARPAAEAIANWGGDARGARPGSSFAGP